MKREICLPSFSGFYESIWMDDDDFRYEMEHHEGVTLFDEWAFDSQSFHKDFAEEYVHFIEKIYQKYIHADIRLTFSEVTSPKYYNFETDKIYAILSVDDDTKLTSDVRRLMHEFSEDLDEIIYDHHTSKDGFISYMSNDLDEWLEHLMDSDEGYIDYALYYLALLAGKIEDMDREAYEEIGVRSSDYWHPESEAAQQEWEEIQRKQEERAWNARHQLKIAFVY